MCPRVKYLFDLTYDVALKNINDKRKNSNFIAALASQPACDYVLPQGKVF